MTLIELLSVMGNVPVCVAYNCVTKIKASSRVFPDGQYKQEIIPIIDNIDGLHLYLYFKSHPNMARSDEMDVIYPYRYCDVKQVHLVKVGYPEELMTELYNIEPTYILQIIIDTKETDFNGIHRCNNS